MAFLIPDKLNDFRAYRGDGEMIGMVDVELPSFEAITETMRGAGIAGEIETPTMGHFGSQSVVLNWRTMTEHVTELLAPVEHSIDLRGSVQMQAPGVGSLVTQAVRVQVLGATKNTTLGTFSPGEQMEASTEVEVAAITISIDGKVVLQLDKYNSIYRVMYGGVLVDFLQKVRVDTGRA